MPDNNIILTKEDKHDIKKVLVAKSLIHKESSDIVTLKFNQGGLLYIKVDSTVTYK